MDQMTALYFKGGAVLLVLCVLCVIFAHLLWRMLRVQWSIVLAWWRRRDPVYRRKMERAELYEAVAGTLVISRTRRDAAYREWRLAIDPGPVRAARLESVRESAAVRYAGTVRVAAEYLKRLGDDERHDVAAYIAHGIYGGRVAVADVVAFLVEESEIAETMPAYVGDHVARLHRRFGNPG